MPTLGLVQAKPHEFLIRLRKGRVLTAVQGGSVFCWPGDTVARVDTSVRRLQFTADQITRERTGVQVTGLAVFRIVQPLIAYRMLDLSDMRGVEGILKEMFVGATRRLVANLSLEECLTRRKEALAAELMAEVAPVVSGSGRPEDDSDRGWGVALDTIEVQDVRVLSQEVFDRLQAPYRESLELAALKAEAEVAAERARLAEETARVEERRRRELMALEEARLEAERERARVAREHEAALSRAALEARLQREDAEAQAQAARDEARARAQLKLALEAAEGAVTQAELRARAERMEQEVRLDGLRAEREIRAQVSEAQLQEIALTQTLPEVARAFRGSYDKIVVTGASDMGFLAQGLGQAIASLQAFGLRLPGLPEQE